MTDAAALDTRSPADVGYLPWLLHRASAVALVVLLALHVAVQAYGFVAPSRWGVYGGLLDLTLGLVLLHGFLGVRATVLESSLPRRVKPALVWLVGVASVGLFAFRVFGPV